MRRAASKRSAPLANAGRVGRMAMGRVSLAGLLCAALLGAGCQGPRAGVADNSSPIPDAANVLPEAPDRLEDLTAPIVVEPGSRYPNLLAAESFAVLLDEDAMLARVRADAQLYGYGEDQLAFELQQTRNLAREFLLCELHLTSNFGDAAIASDAVTLRAFHLSLADDAGRAVGAALVKPAQAGASKTIPNAHLSGVSLVLFPRRVDSSGRPLLSATTQRLRLLLHGLDSRFVAEWRLTPSFQP